VIDVVIALPELVVTQKVLTRLRCCAEMAFSAKASPALPLRPPAPDKRQPTDNAMRKQIAAGSIDAVDRGHDISCTVDPNE
jgi:hypothetical protein